MKKIIISMFTLLLVLAGICFMNVDGSIAMAADGNEKFVAESMTPVEGQVPAKENYIFAGWYKDETCTEPYYSVPTETAYAKFVSEKVLSVKMQLTKGTEAGSPTTNLRLVTSVDSLDYKKVGFKVYFNGATTPVDTGTSRVFERIVASAESGVDYNYSPKVVSTDSEYFATATLVNINGNNFEKDFYIRPYWITYDGTTVYGESRLVQVWHGYTANVINVPVKGTVSGTEVDVTYGDTTVKADVLKVAAGDDIYSQLLIKLGNNGDKTALQSVTTFTVEGFETKYRNLETTHVVKDDATTINADTSWFADYETEDAFVIATSADLYGLATSSSENFDGKTIYVVADIEANKGRADLTGWLSTDEEGNSIEDASAYSWTSIYFNGVFDAQMHTISGLYMNEVMNDSGLFQSIYSTTVIRNLKLTNSYFYGGSGKQRIGSIVGDAQGGTIESVYSDAIVIGDNNNFGGFIGRHKRNTSSLTITNCWFAGSVKNDSLYTGGFIGNALSASTFTNCLNTGNIIGTTNVGGFAGNVDDKTVTLSYCMNDGTITGTAESSMGAIAGMLSATNSQGTVACSNTFISEKCSVMVNGADAEGVTEVTTTSVAGVKALAADTKALFSYVNEETQLNESYWAIVPNGTPVLTTFAEYANAMPVDTSWYNQAEGTATDPYMLKDAADLYGLAFLSQTYNFDKKTIKLSKDITINEGVAANWDTEAPSHNWLPIGRTGGDAQIPRFAGTFDGQMHTISGVYMKSDRSQVGMFGNTNADAVIKNLKLVNSYFETEKDSVGSIAGYGYGTFNTIYSDAIVKGGSAWIGGLIGQTHGATTTNMDNCWFAGEVFQTGEGNENHKACVGGLIGLARNVVTISNCLSTGEISSAYTSGDPCVGGLVGRVTGANAFTLKNSFDAGTIQVAENATSAYGPIAGSVETTGTQTITDNLAYSENYVPDVSTVYDGVTNVSTDDILGTDALKKIPLLFTNMVSTSEYASCWAVVVDEVPVLESFADVIEKEYLAIDTSWYNGDGDYVLSNASDLYGFALMSYRTNFPNETISIDEKVDEIRINEGKPYGENGIVSDTDDWTPKYEWISITPATSLRFAGTFNGNMKTISGIYMNSTKDYSGFFGLTTDSAVVKNLSLTDSYFESTKQDLGSVIGNARGTILNVYSNAIVVSSHKDVGGLVGRVSGSTEFAMSNCWFDGFVTNSGNNTSHRYTGGLIGSVGAASTVTNCLNSGTIAAPNYTSGESTSNAGSIRPHVGGLVGVVDSGKTLNVANCFNSGTVTYNEVATVGYGAIVGNASASGLATLTNTYATETSCEVLATGNVSVNGDETKSTAEAIATWQLPDNYCKGTNALSYMMDLFTYETENGKYENYWSVVPGKTPVLTSYAPQVEDEFLAIDTSWYDGTGSYTLSDVSDFYGFALLSYKKTFAGETITLEEDITINEGIPYGVDGTSGTEDDWSPTYEWVKIGSYDSTNDVHRFAGTFDGKMHTISGIYLQTGQDYSGLFGLIDNDGVVKNFSLLDSYFNCSGKSVGSVVGHSRGTIDTVYSDAIVIGSESNVGGILGQVDSTYGMKSMSNCWFDGTVTNNATEGQRTGGLIGAAIGNVSVENCLNTGAISVPNYAKNEGTEEAPSIKPLVGGLLGYVDSAKTVTVQHCLNIGKVSFNSIATTGFGSVIGRIKSRAEGVTEDGNIIVENTYATSQSSWETVSTSDTWSQVNVSVVDDNVIGGENGKELLSGLFDANLTEKWMIAAEHPVLKVFEKYASTEKNITALHQWVTSSDTLTATLQNPITLPNPEGVALADVRRQGGYTDGRYFYQAFITYTDPGDTDQGIAAETGNKVSVLKYDLINKTEVWLHELTLNHANDITYNSKMKCLVVSHAAPNNKQISYIDVTDEGLVFRETVDIGYDIAYIDYDATRDVYVAGRSSKFFVLNSELKKISKDFTPVRVSGEHTGQGVSCDDNYIYFVLSAGTVETEVIEVYDWSGKLVKTITLDIKTNSETIESENISVVGDKIYIMVAELSDVVGIQYDKPANVYIIDKSITE